MNQSIKIKIATDYSITPGPRYIHEGPFSGQDFRDTILYPKFVEALKQNKKVFVDLDSTAGYGTSFLEESFGGLIREKKMRHKDIINNLELKSIEEPYLINDIYDYLKKANESNKK